MTGLVEHIVALPYQAVVERLLAAMARAGLTVFAQIDHAAGAREAGMAMPPTLVILYGNPKGGTPVMLAEPNTALDLPLRVLVRQREDGQSVVAFHPIAPLLQAAGIAPDLAVRLEPAQQLLLKALAS